MGTWAQKTLIIYTPPLGMTYMPCWSMLIMNC